MPLNIWNPEQVKPRQDCFQSKDPIIQSYYGNYTTTTSMVVINSFTADQNYVVTGIAFSIGGSNLATNAIALAWSKLATMSPTFTSGNYNDNGVIGQIIASQSAASSLLLNLTPYAIYLPKGNILNLFSSSTAGGTLIYYTTTLYLNPMYT